MAVLALFWISTLSATTLVIVQSPQAIFAAVDSREVYREYTPGLIVSAEARTVCKTAKAGPFYIMLAGLIHGSGGFDVLAMAEQTWHDGDSLDQFSNRLADDLPAALTPVIMSVRATDPTAFTAGAVLQMALFGTEQGIPRMVVLEFLSPGSQLETRRNSCPGTCPNLTFGYFLGLHDSIDRFLAHDQRIIDHPDLAGLRHLTGLEYGARPDIVGGPLSVLVVSKTRAAMVEQGACACKDDPLADLDHKIQALSTVVMHQTVNRSFRAGPKVLPIDTIEADVEILDGTEHYSRIRRNGHSYGQLGDLGGARSAGELISILRTTRDALANGSETDRFLWPDTSRKWAIAVDGRRYWLGIQGKITRSVQSGHVARISWISTHPPPETGIDHLAITVDYAEGDVSDAVFALPETSTYRVFHTGKQPRIESNVTRFSALGRYGSEVAISYLP